MRRLRLLRLLPPFLLCLAALSPFAGAADDDGAAQDPPAVASFSQTSQISHVALSPKGGYVAMATMLPDGPQALVISNTAFWRQVETFLDQHLKRAE